MTIASRSLRLLLAVGFVVTGACKPSGTPAGSAAKSADEPLSPPMPPLFVDIPPGMILDQTSLVSLGSYILPMPMVQNPKDGNRPLCAGGMVLITPGEGDTLMAEITCPSIAPADREALVAAVYGRDVQNVDQALMKAQTLRQRLYTKMLKATTTPKNFVLPITLTKSRDGLYTGCSRSSCGFRYGAFAAETLGAGSCGFDLSLMSGQSKAAAPIESAKLGTVSKCMFGNVINMMRMPSAELPRAGMATSARARMLWLMVGGPERMDWGAMLVGEMADGTKIPAYVVNGGYWMVDPNFKPEVRLPDGGMLPAGQD